MSENPFDIIAKKIPNICYICAPPASGKTYFLKYLLSELFRQKKLKYGIIFSPSKFTGSYDFLPKEYVHSKYDENILIKLFNMQVKTKSNTDKNPPPAFVVFDDCIGSVQFKSSKFEKIISLYRHPNITMIFITQHIYAVPPLLRKCTRFFITFNVTDENTIDAIRKNFMLDKKKNEIEKFIDDNTKEDFSFILVDTAAKKKEKYYFGKAPEKYKQFKI
eukprot:gene4128-gene7033